MNIHNVVLGFFFLRFLVCNQSYGWIVHAVYWQEGVQEKHSGFPWFHGIKHILDSGSISVCTGLLTQVSKGSSYTKVKDFLPYCSWNNSIFKVRQNEYVHMWPFFWSITQKIRTTYLPKILYLLPAPKNLKDSNLLALYH